MALNIKCPKCGSEKVQLSDVKRKSGCWGCLWYILFGFFYIMWIMMKWMIGLMVLLCLDWWLAIIYACQKKGYSWKWKRWFTTTRKTYYCHDCGHNFVA